MYVHAYWEGLGERRVSGNLEVTGAHAAVTAASSWGTQKGEAGRGLGWEVTGSPCGWGASSGLRGDQEPDQDATRTVAAGKGRLRSG